MARIRTHQTLPQAPSDHQPLRFMLDPRRWLRTIRHGFSRKARPLRSDDTLWDIVALDQKAPTADGDSIQPYAHRSGVHDRQ